YYHEALEKSRRMLGEEHPDTLISISNMGFLLSAQGKLAEAEPYYREALEKFRRVLGEEHPDTLVSISYTGVLLRAQGKLAEAETYYHEALEKFRRVLGEEHPYTLTSINNMGDLLKTQRRFPEAEEYLIEAHALSSGDSNSADQATTQALVDLYLAWHEAEPDQGHDAEAARWQAMLGAVANVVDEDD
ncbi:MAG: tetratricopeptide repeat protein, partial [Phycisphaerales bacterium]|nr:tetratricopeptide repeat protein [Phycisphaerales bacterium]